MNYLRRCLIGLLVLMLALSVQAALSEEEISPEEFYFVPGQDLVVSDDQGRTITLKGNQPSRVYSDGYDLEFRIENHNDASIKVAMFLTVNDKIELQAFDDMSARTVLVPANGSANFTVHIIPALLEAYNEGNVTAGELSEIRDFSGIRTLSFVEDSWYASEPGHYLTVSCLGLIHF